MTNANTGQKSESPKKGRPTIYTDKLANTICTLIAEGQSLRRICKQESMPDKSTVFAWLSEKSDFSDQYVKARALQADSLFDEVIDIADDGENDSYLDDDGNARIDHDVIARSRLRIDSRKWVAGKLRPKVYGDKTEPVEASNELIGLFKDMFSRLPD